jgi:hypothetical protein
VVRGSNSLSTRRLTLQPTDFIVLAVVVGFVLPIASDLLGIRDPCTIVVLGVCWACAALKRLMAWRNGQSRPPLQDERVKAAASVIIIVGIAPWVVLPLLQLHYPHASLWAPISLPAWLRAGGAVLMLCGVMRPFLAAALPSDRPDLATATIGPSAVGSVTPGMILDGLGFGLLAASPLLGVLITIWLALTCRVNRVRGGLLLSQSPNFEKSKKRRNKVFSYGANSGPSAVSTRELMSSWSASCLLTESSDLSDA